MERNRKHTTSTSTSNDVRFIAKYSNGSVRISHDGDPIKVLSLVMQGIADLKDKEFDDMDDAEFIGIATASLISNLYGPNAVDDDDDCDGDCYHCHLCNDEDEDEDEENDRR